VKDSTESDESVEDTVAPYQKLLDDTATTSSIIKKQLKQISNKKELAEEDDEEEEDEEEDEADVVDDDKSDDDDDDEQDSGQSNDEESARPSTYSLEVLCKDNLEEEEESSLLNDPFHVHFEKNLDEKLVEKLKQTLADRAKLSEQEQRLHWSTLGDLNYMPPLGETKVSLDEAKEIKSHVIKQRILERLNEANGSQSLDKFQRETLNVISTYADFYNPNVDIKMDTKNKFTYAIHALNHVLKTRSRIIAHNDKIKQSKSSQEMEYRDQGLTRPKVLIVVPFRKFALKLVNMFVALIMRKSEEFVSNKKRFQDAFGPLGDEDDNDSTKKDEEDDECGENGQLKNDKEKKFEDFDFLFSGNNEDHCNLLFLNRNFY
jgi:U3 small nucleolar RNA-associated protein 25